MPLLRVILAVVVGAMFVAKAPAQGVQSAELTGVYEGTFADATGASTFRLALQMSANGALTGVLTLDPTSASPDTAASHTVTGFFDPVSGKFSLRPLRWLTASPPRVRMFSLAGTVTPGADHLEGRITSGRGTFTAERNAEESTNVAALIPASNARPGAPPVRSRAISPGPAPLEEQATATPPARPRVANPARAPVQAQPPTAAPSLTAAQLSPATINGVYTGNYQCVDGSLKAKVSLKATDDGALTGLFTFDLPVWAGGHQVTYKLTGRFVPGNRFPYQFATLEPLGPPAPPAYAPTSVNAYFGTGQYVRGPDGSLQDGLNPDHLKGATPGHASVGFDTLRDKAASADLDNVMAAQASAAVAAANTASTAPARPMARIHSIDGVYSGTLTGPQGTGKFQLIITQTGGGKLTGVVTVFPADEASGKGVSYELDGANDPMNHRFELHARNGQTPPPGDLLAPGFGGTFTPDLAHNTARVFGSTRSGARFDASWDAVATAENDVAVANRKAAEGAAYAAAMKTFEETMRNAQPRELASNDLVRKSRAYWDNYQTDMIREVFDGGFGPGIEENADFQKVFCTFIEMFSAKCPDSLPANHQRVTMTWRTNRKFDNNGNLTSEENHDYTVDMDPRFVEKYLQCAAALSSKGAEIREVFAAAQAGGAQHTLHDLMALAQDMQRFFADHGGKSAAMRQMSENFRRAVNGEPSLQQAGGKIDGARAESDPNLPPGRYARFVDGANAFYRDPANARYRSRNSTAFCQALAVACEFKMSRDEDYYYANDFKARFFDQIMQPQDRCTDPEWPLLHPVVEACIAATQ